MQGARGSACVAEMLRCSVPFVPVCSSDTLAVSGFVRPRMTPPRVLVVLDSSAAWSRGALRGFARVADEEGWTLHHYDAARDLNALAAEFPARAAVIGPRFVGAWPARLRECVSVSINTDRCAEGIASVCLDEARTAELAASHLLARGFRNITSFRLADWGSRREQRFRDAAAQRGAQLEPGWWSSERSLLSPEKQPAAIIDWLLKLRKPCAVFALCDGWARMLARYARDAGLRVPEDIAVLGVDNDVFQCELDAPALSSIEVPWQLFGESAAHLVQLGLRGEPIAGRRVLVPPVDVVTRRSSDALAIEDVLVAEAMSWIRAHATERLSVPIIAKALGVGRQTLERRFRRRLGRTIVDEVRRARVEVARSLLATNDLPLLEVARQSGFATAALMNVAFHREVGLPPGAYRRQTRGASAFP
jgi:LacI family transcriptional regulator